MALFTNLARLISRFRYPVCLPEDLAKDIGITLSNHLPYHDFLSFLSYCRPTKLRKYMPRSEAEALFRSALKKEFFKNNSLFSYDFHRGWLIFALHFDDHNRLRRVNLQYPMASKLSECDLPLALEADY